LSSSGQHAEISVEYGFAEETTFPFIISQFPQQASKGMGGGVPAHLLFLLHPRHSTRHCGVVSEYYLKIISMNFTENFNGNFDEYLNEHFGNGQIRRGSP